MPCHNDTIIKTDAGILLYKICTSHFICKGSKRVTQGLRVRGSRRPNRNCNILTPTTLCLSRCWPATLCLSRSPDAQPEAQRHTLVGNGFLYCILSASFLDPNSSGPQAPSAWRGFHYHNSSITSSPALTATATVLTSVLTELYNSSTSTQSLTRSLKSHV